MTSECFTFPSGIWHLDCECLGEKVAVQKYLKAWYVVGAEESVAE